MANRGHGFPPRTPVVSLPELPSPTVIRVDEPSRHRSIPHLVFAQIVKALVLQEPVVLPQLISDSLEPTHQAEFGHLLDRLHVHPRHAGSRQSHQVLLG